MKNRPILVLLSGGQDSTTCLWMARHEYPEAPIHALSIHYGQKHASELGAAAEIALLAGCASHDMVDASSVLGGAHSALTDDRIELKGSGGYADVEMPGGLPTSFVPGRNLVFLAIAAAYAAKYRCALIITGVCETDYSGYPDCRREFLTAMQSAIVAAMPTELADISVIAPLLSLTKAETVAALKAIAVVESEKLGAPELWTEHPAWRSLGRSVTCYQGARPGCGTCGACVLRAKGFTAANEVDPAGTAVQLPPRGNAGLSPYEARAAASGAAIGEADTQDPDALIEMRSVQAANGGFVNVIVRANRIELRGAEGGTFTLREAADALEAVGIPAGNAVFDRLDFKAGIEPTRLTEDELRTMAEAAVEEIDPRQLGFLIEVEVPPSDGVVQDPGAFDGQATEPKP